MGADLQNDNYCHFETGLNHFGHLIILAKFGLYLVILASFAGQSRSFWSVFWGVISEGGVKLSALKHSFREFFKGAHSRSKRLFIKRAKITTKTVSWKINHFITCIFTHILILLGFLSPN